MIKKRKFALVIAAALLMTTAVSACSRQERSEVEEGKRVISEMQPELSKRKEAFNTSQTTDLAGFDSPESAVTAYLEGLRDGDFNRMRDTFAENINTDDIRRQYTILCGLELDAEGPVSIKNSEDAKQFMEKIESHMKAVDFGSMKLLGFAAQEDLVDADYEQNYQELLKKAAQDNYGEKMVSCVAAIEVGGIKYILIFDVIEKNGRWFNNRLGGVYARMGGLEGYAAGTIPLEADDDEMLIQLIPDFNKNLLKPKEVSDTGIPESVRIEAEGFDSPQLAAKAYLDNLAGSDPDKALKTFALESYVDHYNFQAALESSGGYDTEQLFALPAVNNFIRDINIEKRKTEIEQNLISHYMVLALYKGMENRHQLVKGHEDLPVKLSRLSNNVDLSSMNILGYINPEQLPEFNELTGYQNIKSKQSERYGAEDIENTMIVFELDGTRYCFCAETVQYGTRWFVKQPGGLLSSLFHIDINFEGMIPVKGLDNLDIDKLILPFS
nr:hypothetical protein [uncultured Clostridium sp.]